MPVTLTKTKAVYMAGTATTWAEDGKHAQEHGWINPSWSIHVIHETREDAGPIATYDPDDDKSPAEWLADQVLDNVGFIDSVNGEVFYACDSLTELGDPVDVSAQVIAKGFTDREIERAVEIIQSRQPIHIS